MSNWREEEKDRIRKLNAHADALERREKVLIDAIADLTQGYGVEVPGKTWATAMQKLAGNKLAEVAKTRIPPRPYV